MSKVEDFGEGWTLDKVSNDERTVFRNVDPAKNTIVVHGPLVNLRANRATCGLLMETSGIIVRKTPPQ